MGAVNFDDAYMWSGTSVHYPMLRPGPVSVSEAFTTLHDESGYQDGHRYSGTISCTTLTSVDTTPTTLAQAMKRADNASVPKGDCHAIALLEETSDVWEHGEDQTLTVTVPEAVYHDRDRMAAHLAKELNLDPAQVRDWRVTWRGMTSSVTTTSKTTTTATKGKTQTRYFAILDSDQTLPEWDSGYPSQSAARAGLEALINANVGVGMRKRAEVSGQVVSMTRRVTGEPLVVGSGFVKKVTAELVVSTATLVAAATVGTKQAGWFFHGCAPS